MSEKSIFELRVLKDGAPLLIQITNREINFSARIEEDKEPDPESLKIIDEIDDFSHKKHLHTCPKEVKKPERISFFINPLSKK